MDYNPPTFYKQFIDSLIVLYTIFLKRTSRMIDSSHVLIVMDAIKAYESMFSENQLIMLENTIKVARKANCKIIFTRWVRYRKTNYEEEDEIDKKGHWSFFIPQNGSELLFNPEESDSVIDVCHTNIFLHDDFCQQIDNSNTLIFTGGWAESCIINSVRHSVDKNYKTVVVQDACMGHFGARQHAFYVLQLIYTTVVNCIYQN